MFGGPNVSFSPSDDPSDTSTSLTNDVADEAATQNDVEAPNKRLKSMDSRNNAAPGASLGREVGRVHLSELGGSVSSASHEWAF